MKWDFHRSRPKKRESRSLVLYGNMIADDIVTQCRVAALIKALEATLVVLSNRRCRFEEEGAAQPEGSGPSKEGSTDKGAADADAQPYS